MLCLYNPDGNNYYSGHIFGNMTQSQIDKKCKVIEDEDKPDKTGVALWIIILGYALAMTFVILVIILISVFLVKWYQKRGAEDYFRP